MVVPTAAALFAGLRWLLDDRLGWRNVEGYLTWCPTVWGVIGQERAIVETVLAALSVAVSITILLWLVLAAWRQLDLRNAVLSVCLATLLVVPAAWTLTESPHDRWYPTGHQWLWPELGFLPILLALLIMTPALLPGRRGLHALVVLLLACAAFVVVRHAVADQPSEVSVNRIAQCIPP